MERLNPKMYRLYKKSERLYKLGIVRFSTYLKIRGMYHHSIRPKPSKNP